MKTFILSLGLVICCASIGISQYYYGVKGGIGLNMQKWNSYERDILFTPNIDVFTESKDDPLNRLYASLGFHTRGSVVRGFGFMSYNPYKFHNIVFEAGGKRILSIDQKYNGYYLLGLRAEYTVATNLSDNSLTSIYNLVSDDFVRKFNYGATVGGGFELEYSDTKVLFLEFCVSPDLSKQYEQLETVTIKNPNPSPFSPNEYVTIVPQEVRNISLEVKVGIKFLRGYEEYE